MNTWSAFAVAAMMASGVALSGCSNDKTDTPDDANADAGAKSGGEAAATQSIVEIAVGNEDFSTLVDLLTKAGLVDTLKGEGPFTVFAPTNAAFAKVDKATLDSLAADKEKLKAVLLYHVVSGKVMAADAMKLSEAGTVNGAKAKIEVRDGSVYVAGAKVTTADVAATNGVIHIVDSVMLPPAN